MKKIFVLALFCLCLVACRDENSDKSHWSYPTSTTSFYKDSTETVIITRLYDKTNIIVIRKDTIVNQTIFE